tara:strand:- start:412 stop:624 length:213 start_codon:yes stop_codon:yes gene_type:complete
MKHLNKFLGYFGKFLTYMLNNQMGVQSNIFWLVALFKINTDQFWTFAVPAIVFRGLQMIIDELQKNNNKK